MELVHYAVERGIATVTLDSPENRNALSDQLVGELWAHLCQARDDGEVRGVVLTATGNTFCAGADLKRSGGPGAGATLPQVLEGLWQYPKTTVVALNGHVRAGGTGIVAAADIVLAPTDATFAFTEVRIGVAPAIIAVLCLRRMTSRAASRYLLTGETFDATAAVDAGLVTAVAEREALDALVAGVLDAIRLTEPTAVRTTKELIVDLPGRTVADGLAHASGVSAALFASAAAAEGIASFRERRPPSWAR